MSSAAEALLGGTHTEGVYLKKNLRDIAFCSAIDAGSESVEQELALFPSNNIQGLINLYNSGRIYEAVKENNVEIRVLRSTSSRVDLAKVRIV